MEAVRTDVRAQEVLAVSAKVDAALLTATSTLGEVLAEKAEAEAIKGSIEESVSLANEAVALTSELVLKGTLLNSETESIRGLVESLYNTVEYDTSVSREIRSFVENLYVSFNTTYFGGRIEVPDDSEGIVGSMYYDHTLRQLMVKVSETVWRSPCDLVGYVSILLKGAPDGVAELDGNGLVPSYQLPSYVDDVLEYSTKADLPLVGERGKIYVVVVDESSNGDTSSYRWTGTIYAMVSNTLNAADVKVLYESNLDTNEFNDAEKAKVSYISVTQNVNLDTVESDTVLNNTHRASTGTDHTYIDQSVTTTATPRFAGIVTEGLVDGRDISIDGSKLDGIEDNATADQTAIEIEALYEGLLDTNKYTDAEKLQLSNTESTAQLNARDIANRERINHTGTQTASTISDFDVSVTNSTQVTSNTANIASNTGLILGNTNSILQLAKSNTHGAFGSPSLSINVGSTSETLPFSVIMQSTNTDRFVINADNTITAKASGTYVFNSTLNIEDAGANGAVRGLVFKVTDGTNVWHTETVNVEISGSDRDVIPVNSVIVLPEGAIVPATAYITVEHPSGISGYRIVGFQSILATEKTVAEIQGLATATIVTSYGTMASTNVQSALQELVDEKVPLNSDFILDLGGII